MSAKKGPPPPKKANRPPPPKKKDPRDVLLTEMMKSYLDLEARLTLLESSVCIESQKNMALNQLRRG